MGDRANIKLKKDINTTIIASIIFCIGSAMMGILLTNEWPKLVSFFISGAFFMMFLWGLNQKKRVNKLG